MDPTDKPTMAIVVPFLLGALDLLTRLIPVVQKLHIGGQVSIEDQAKIRNAYNTFRDAGDAAFEGPEWKLSSETGPNPTNQP